MIKIAMFDTKKYDREGFEKYLGGRDDVSVTYLEGKLKPETAFVAGGCDAVIAFVNDDISAETVEKLHECGVRAIFLRCAGYNNVDIKACFGKIHVFRVPAYSPNAVAEHAFALVSALNRRIHKAYNRTREHNFSLENLVGFDLCGKTMGIVGTGRIGRVMADIALGYGMKVLCYDRHPVQSDKLVYTDLDGLFSGSDIISLHCPLTDETRNMINAASIAKMKDGVMIINTSRGGLVDSGALLSAIKSRKIGSAGLDVYDEESDIFYEDRSSSILDDDTLLELIAMPNVIVTSHQAFLTAEALDNIALTTAENIAAFFSGKTSDNEVCYHCDRIGECRKKRRKSCF